MKLLSACLLAAAAVCAAGSVRAQSGPLLFDPSAVATQTFIAGKSIDVLTLPTASGGTPNYNYSLRGAPAGLRFDAAAPPTLSGAPEENTARDYRVTLTVEDAASASVSLTFGIRVLASANICSRTPQVEEALLAQLALPAEDCATVSSTALANIRSLNLHNESISALQDGDFADLDALQMLRLDGNALVALPSGVFTGLNALQTLRLDGNALASLPPEVFADLNALEILRLDGNALASLLPEVFADLNALETLRLNGNALVSLPPGAFTGLNALEILRLDGNGLASLPIGLFAPLLDTLTFFSGGPPFPLKTTYSIEAEPGIIEGQTQVIRFHLAPALRPFAVSIPYSVGFNGARVADFDTTSAGCATPANDFITIAAGQTSAELTFCAATDGEPESGELLRFTLGLTIRPASDAGVRARANFPLAAVANLRLNAARSSVDLSLMDLAFTPASIEEQVYIMGTDIGTFLLPEASGGVPAYSYTLGGASTGLSFYDGDSNGDGAADEAPTLNGTPTAEGTFRLTFTVRDSSTPTAATLSVVFSVIVAPAGDVCHRSDRVKRAILGALGLSAADCGMVSDTQLASIVNLQVPFSVAVLRLRRGDFAGLSSLQSLNLRSSRLEELPPGVFAGLRSLQMLDLRFNRLTELPPGVFADLRALQMLYLGRNQFTARPPLPAGIFADLSALQWLDLEGNALPEIRAEMFAGLGALQTLYLNNNALTALPEEVFSGLGALEELFLGGNAFTELPSGVFTGLGALQTLYLNHNALTALPTGVFSGLAVLEELHLESNALAELPPGIFAGLGSLQWLDLEENALTALPAGVFNGLGTLQILKLSGNELTERPTGLFSPLLDTLTFFSGTAPSFPLQATYRVSRGLPSINEGQARVVRFELAPAPELFAVSFPYTISFSGGASAADFDATGAACAAPEAGFLSIAAGQTSADLTFCTAADGDMDPAKSLTLLLGSEARPASDAGVRAHADFPLPFVAHLQADTAHSSVELPLVNALAFAPGTIADQSYNAGADIATLALPDACCGMEPYTYTLGGAPAGLSFHDGDSDSDSDGAADTSATLSGMLADNSVGDYRLTFTVTDALGSRFSLHFGFGVNPPLAFAQNLVEDQSYTAGTAIPALTLPTVSGGTAPYRFALAGAPAGLLLDNSANPPRLSGIPAYDSAGNYRLRFTVSDSSTAPAAPLGLEFNVIVTPMRSFCSRTDQVESAILDRLELSIADCHTVSGAQLATVRNLSLISRSLKYLQEGDFSGLSGLQSLLLRNNELAALPEGVFSGLSALQTLDLAHNELAALPEGVFSGLGALEVLFLGGNAFTEVPSGVFAGLATLRTLDIFDNKLTALPAGVFADLHALEVLFLNNNALTELPTGLLIPLLDTLNDFNGRTLFPLEATYSVTGEVDPGIIEGQDHVLRFELKPALRPFAVSIPYTVALLGGANAADFDTTAGCAAAEDGFIRIAAGQTSADLTFCAAADGNPEPAESLRLTLGAEARPASDTGVRAAANFPLRLVANLHIDTAFSSVELPIMEPAPLAFRSATVNDQSYTAGLPIATLTLPAAVGGSPEYTYTLGGERNGLRFNDATPPTLSGAPDAAAAATPLTFGVTDAASVSLSLTFAVTVVSAPADFGDTTIADQTYTATAPFSLSLPQVSSGSIGTVYSLEIGDLSGAGTAFAPNTRLLSGLESTTSDSLLRYSASNGSGSDSLLFRVVVVAAPMFAAAPSVAQQVATVAQPIALGVQLPAVASGGFGALRYTVQDAAGNPVPGMTVVANTATDIRYTGRPTTFGVYDLSYRATDQNGAFTEIFFRFTVNAAPTFATALADQTFSRGGAVSLTLPHAAFQPPPLDTRRSGTAPLTFSLDGILPDGLGFDAATRVLSGTPSAAAAASTELIYRLGDANNVEAPPLRYTVTVLEGPDFGAATVAEQSYTVSRQIPSLTLPTATAPAGELSFAISDFDGLRGLRLGESGTPSTYTLSGAPDSAAAVHNVVWSAIDANGAAANLTFTVRVFAVPNFTVAQQQENLALAFNAPIDPPLTLPVASNGRPALTYALSGALPVGLSFAPNTRLLSGTPTVEISGAQLSYTATDANGVATEQFFTITVSATPVFADEGISLTYTVGQKDISFSFPRASGAGLNYSFALSGAPLPTGLRVVPVARVLIGEPTAAHSANAATAIALTAADALGQGDTYTATIVVVAAPRFVAGASVDDQSYTAARDIATLLFPLDADGTGLSPLSFTLTPAAPDDLVFDAGDATGDLAPSLRGAPNAAAVQDATEYVYALIDANGVRATLTFRISVAEAVSFGSATVAEQSYTKDAAITALRLPAASGGVGGLSYAISDFDGLSGLVLNESSGVYTLSGEPDSSAGSYSVMWSATDSNGAAAALGFTVRVFAAPSFTDAQQQANLVLPLDTNISPVELPAVSGGRPALRYALSAANGGALPAGLNFAADTRLLSGLPTVEDLRGADLSYRATDANGVAAEQFFTIAVSGGPVFVDTGATLTYTVGQKIADLTLPAASGGASGLTYALTRSGAVLPSGLNLEEASRVLSGTPAAATSQAVVIVLRASDASKRSATYSLRIRVAAAPRFATGARIADQAFTRDVDIPALTLPIVVANSGAAPLRYTLNPAAPAGLSFVAVAGAAPLLRGTPSAVSAQRAYIYQASDANDIAVALTFRLTVNGPLGFATATQEDLSFTVGEAIAALTLPAAAGGTAPLRYSLSPSLESNGLTFTAASRTLGGTPVALAAATEMVLTVRDSAAATATASLRFALTVHPASLTLIPPTVAAQTYTADDPIATLTLPAAAGGVGALRYTLGGAPSGLEFNAATRTLSGTPPADAVGTHSLTFAVRDSASPPRSRSILFRIIVTPKPLVFTPSTVEDLSYMVGLPIATLILPAARDGTPGYSYALSGLPAGLLFNGNSTPPTVSGAALLAAVGTHTLSYSVSDRAGAAARISFRITISLQPLVFNPGSVNDQIYTAAADITPLSLPSLGGGVGAVSYALQGAPAGLRFATATRILSGAPAMATTALRVVYIASDSARPPRTLNLTFRITVNGIGERTQAVQNKILQQLPTDDPDAVSAADLAAISVLDLADQSLETLQEKDLAGLSGLQMLDLSGNPLETLPEEIFADLQTLTFLDLSANRLGTLPPAIFDSVGAQLEHLDLSDNQQLNALPQGIFDNLDNLKTLLLGGNTALNTLPAELFSPLLDTLLELDTTDVPNFPLEATVSLTGETERSIKEQDRQVVAMELLPELRFFHVRVPYSIHLGGGASEADFDATSDGCTAPKDGFIFFAANKAGSAELTFCLIDDGVDEPGESFTFRIADGASPASTKDDPAPAAVASQLALITRHASKHQASFNIVAAPLIFDPSTVADYSYTAGASIEPLVLPVARGGSGDKRYTLEGIPEGLVFGAATRTLSGIPSVVDPEGALLTYTVSDSAAVPLRAQLSFRIIVIPGVEHFAVLNRVLLPEVARAIADQNISAIAQRIAQLRDGLNSNGDGLELQGSLGGQSSLPGLLSNHGVTLLQGEGLKVRDILGKSHFVLPFNARHLADEEAAEQRSSNFYLWGSGAYRNLSGDQSGVDWDGTLSSAHLGLDTLIGERFLAGLALSQSSSDLNYELDTKSGTHRVNVSNLNPYLAWTSADARMEMWATAGFGQGDLEIDDDAVARTADSDVDMLSLGGGVRSALHNANSRTKLKLRLRGDALLAHLEVKESEDIEALEVDVSRLRLALEASSTIALSGGGQLEPLLEMGLRYDGADGDTRSALELGLGVRHHAASLGLSLEGRIHILLNADEYSEYGAKATLQLQPNPNKGLSLKLNSGYGAPANPKVQEIWQRDLDPRERNNNDDFRVNAHLGYGIPTNTSRHRTLLTPYTEFTLDGTNPRNTLGLLWKLSPTSTLQLERAKEQDKPPATKLKAQLRF